MVEIEPRIVLIDQNDNAVEVQSTDRPGAANQLASLRLVLTEGLASGLLATNPFIISQPEADQGPKAPAQKSREHTLRLATTAYTDKLQDPQRLHDFYQAYWDFYGIEKMGLSQRDTRVAAVPYTEEDIWQFMKLEDPQDGNPDADLGYFQLPVLASSDGRLLIGRGFANLGAVWAFQAGSDVTNSHQATGWMRVDASLDAPYRKNQQGKLTGLSVLELREDMKVGKRIGQTVNLYGPSGNVIKQIHGYYPDQGSTWSHLPGSVWRGKCLIASFNSYGYFGVGSGWFPGDRHPEFGGRSFLGA